MLLLCIDDDPEDVELLIEAVNTIDSATTCLTASDGREALKLLDNHTPDCIFLDLNMPGMNGKETLRKIRDIDALKQIPVCVLSTHINAEDKRILKALGANNCIKKPNSLPALRNAIQFIFQSN